MGILLIGETVQLGILYNILRYELQRNGSAKLMLYEPIAKHKTLYVKFQTSVPLYLYFERNIASWIVNPI